MNDYNQNESSQGAGCLIMALLGIGAIVYLLFVAQLFSNSAHNRRHSKARAIMTIRAMFSAQQVYFFDRGKFANEIDKLKLGIHSETDNYKYSIRATDSATFHYAISKQDDLESYIGALFLRVDPASLEETILAILCKAVRPGTVIPAEPQMENGVPTCGAGTE